MFRDKNPVRKEGTDMAKKTVKLRPRTATEVYKLKGLAKKKNWRSENRKSVEADNPCGGKQELLARPVVRYEGLNMNSRTAYTRCAVFFFPTA
jgi:hypothetical protein